MSQALPGATGKIPRWLIIIGSVAIAAHLLAVAGVVLAAPSGPWPTPDGFGTASGPQIAQVINGPAASAYLKLVRMTHNYHFSSNRPGAPEFYFEVRLKDGSGNQMETLRFPEKHVNFWVRHRQALLARGLGEDLPIQPPQGELLAAPNQQLREVQIWEMTEPRSLKIRTIPEHLIQRDRPVSGPSEWALLAARSYARYLCRTRGAASVELIRHSRESLPPAAFMTDEAPPGPFDDLVANFGELARE